MIPYIFRYGNSIGVTALRKHVLELTFAKYQAHIPELLKRLRVMKKKSGILLSLIFTYEIEESLSQIQKQSLSIDTNKLRGAAAKYVMNFLQVR